MQDLTGQQFGEYLLIRCLGKGSYGEVYLGQHLEEHSQVAIKVLYETTPVSLDRFRQEARTIARLQHPHIVKLLGFDAEQGIPYLVMDYAPNGTLRDRHPVGTQLPFSSVISYVKQIAEALQYAHEQYLIHGHIKPENLLLGSNNEVLVTDFGISVFVEQSRTHDSGDRFRGTPIYAAPEQFENKRRKESDQYAVGVMVYTWLTGEYPFDGPNWLAIGFKKQDPPPSLRDRAPSIPPEVEEVVLTALAKDAKKRFASVQAFAAALEQAAQTSQEQARRTFSGEADSTGGLASSQARLPGSYSTVELLEPVILPDIVNGEDLPAEPTGKFAQPTEPLPPNLHEALQLAKRYRTQKHVEQAIAVLKNLCALLPQEPIPHAELGDLYIGWGMLEEGVNELSEVVMLYLQTGQNAEAAQVLQRLASIYWDMGNQEETIKTCRQVIQLIPDDMQARMELVQYCLQGDWRQEAVTQQSVIARRYLAAHQTKEAVSSLQQLIAMDKGNLEAYDLLGQVYAEVGEYEQAARVYRNLAKVEPDNRLASERLHQLEELQTKVAAS